MLIQNTFKNFYSKKKEKKLIIGYYFFLYVVYSSSLRPFCLMTSENKQKELRPKLLYYMLKYYI